MTERLTPEAKGEHTLGAAGRGLVKTACTRSRYGWREPAGTLCRAACGRKSGSTRTRHSSRSSWPSSSSVVETRLNEGGKRPQKVTPEFGCVGIVSIVQRSVIVMRSSHPIAMLTVICFCLVLAWYGLEKTQFSLDGYFRQVTADTPREAYRARLEAEQAARKAAVERRKQMRARRRMQGW
jgi:hypothetical protein